MAFAHRTEMESAIGDAAEQLATSYLDQGHHPDTVELYKRLRGTRMLRT